MKAAICYEFGQPLVVEEVKLDPPQAGEVRVQVAACAIRHSDVHQIREKSAGFRSALQVFLPRSASYTH